MGRNEDEDEDGSRKKDDENTNKDGDGEEKKGSHPNAIEVKKDEQEELEMVKNFMADLEVRDDWRRSLQKKNSVSSSVSSSMSAVTKGDLELDDIFGTSKLDSSLKKNNAFIRKLKNFNENSKDSLLTELRTLNVSKYLSEIAFALTEAKLKMSGVPAAVEMCSEIHQKYNEFASSLHFAWTKVFAFATPENRKKGNKSTSAPITAVTATTSSSTASASSSIINVSKTRVDIRFYCELISVGVFTLKTSLPLLGHIITFLATPPIEIPHLALLIVFCKYNGDDFAGLRYPAKIEGLALKHRVTVPEFSGPLLPPEKMQNVKTLLTSYFTSVSAVLVSEWHQLSALDKSNRRILLTKGELHNERRDKAENLRLSVSRLETSLEQLGDWLHLDMPIREKEEDEEDEAATNGISLDVMDQNEIVSDKWEDEEMRDFYESLPDLKAFVPAILYKVDSAKKEGSDENNESIKDSDGKEKDNKNDDNKVEESEDDIRRELEMEEQQQAVNENDGNAEGTDEEPLINQMEKIEELESELSSVAPSQKMMLDAFLSGLQNCVSREAVDNAAADFGLKYNTKVGRRRLSKFLFNVPRQRIDLLPFYARLVATLKPVASEVADDLVALLGSDFRYQLRKKDQLRLESKLKICRFIAELVKFAIYPKSEVLFHLKQLLFVFTHHNIEMFCTTMESCGRYLYCDPVSRTRVKIYLEQMMRKKKALLSLDERYSVMIENAFYTVIPNNEIMKDTELASRINKKSGFQLYFEKLIYHSLEKNNCNRVLKQLRKNAWNKSANREIVISVMKKAWNVKYYNIQHLASVVAGLVPYHDWLGVRVVDSILEEIRVQLESEDKRHNQRRISTIRYMAELYNYRVLDSSVVFKVLYLIISFNHFNEDEILLRLRLVCVVLEYSGAFLRDAKSSRKKLQYFIDFFQRYYWQSRLSYEASSSSPFPFMLGNLVSETLSTLKSPLLSSLEEAEKKCEETQKELIGMAKKRMPQLTSALLKETNTLSTSSSASTKERMKGEHLGVIVEESDDDEDYDDDDDEGDKRKGGSQEDDENEDDNENDGQEEDVDGASLGEKTEDEDDDEDDEDDDDDDDEEEDDDNDDDYENADTLEPKRVGALRKIACVEDDEFCALLDQVVSESLNESSGRSGTRGSTVAPVAPVANRPRKIVATSSTNNSFAPEFEEPTTMQFSLLVKKGGKSGYKDLAVPKDSEMARNLQIQEEIDRQEKERVKRLTLQINERQEEEDMLEALAAMQRPSVSDHRHQERSARYQHPRGAPDASLIFGTRRTSTR